MNSAVIIIIIIIIIFLFLIFPKKKKEPKDNLWVPPPPQPSYKTKITIKIYHQKTYIKGKLISKYCGHLDYVKDAEKYVNEKYYNFSLYDAEITETNIKKHKEGPFLEFSKEKIFLNEIKPSPLPCKISYYSTEGDFNVELHDVVLANIDFNKYRALHLVEGDEVYGTMEADITGYTLEVIPKKTEETVFLGPQYTKNNNQASLHIPNIYKTKEKKGTEVKGEYEWTEYWYSDRIKTYLADPKFIGKKEPEFITIWHLLGIILGILFLFAIGPQGIMGLLFFAALVLLIIYFSTVLKWLFRIAGILMLLLAIIGLIAALQNKKHTSSKPFVQDDPKEINKTQPEEINSNDSLITHHRIWKDYEGNQYEGDVWVKSADFTQSAKFKNDLSIKGFSLPAYDRLLFDLKNKDSAKLSGVYQLLDNIRRTHNQNNNQFAETVVSFIQDIPYAIILDNACDANLYNDNFTKAYLLNNQGDCQPYQRFGINTPVEFMGNLKGDCDTRTLLLYTMFSHYNYEVALLSSEIYSHSILAINLPFKGKSITINGKQYFVWETTSPNIRAGLLPEEISNFNNWRISLLSKP